MRNWSLLTKENEPREDGLYWVKNGIYDPPTIVECYRNMWLFLNGEYFAILYGIYKYICLAPAQPPPFDYDKGSEETCEVINKLREEIKQLREEIKK